MDDLLDIPDWLRREKGKTVEHCEETVEVPPVESPGYTHRLHLRDQLPTIGSGMRYVTAKIGRKWVHITSECGRVKTKTPLVAWHQLKKEEL